MGTTHITQERLHDENITAVRRPFHVTRLRLTNALCIGVVRTCSIVHVGSD